MGPPPLSPLEHGCLGRASLSLVAERQRSGSRNQARALFRSDIPSSEEKESEHSAVASHYCEDEIPITVRS